MTDAQRRALALASRLLEYPDADFFASLPQLEAEAAALAEECPALADFLAQIRLAEGESCRQDYVALFDHDPAASLYMSWHRYGNDRSQGRAMAALNGLYRAAGFEPVPGVMPDYLPRMLEFLAVCEDWAAETLLDGFGPELHKLLAHLQSAQCPQAAMLAAALEPLRQQWPQRFLPRAKPDPTQRPMARPEPEPGN